ncbi:MAG: carbohydrate ABC transporter permease [Chloroflexota bacterium]
MSLFPKVGRKQPAMRLSRSVLWTFLTVGMLLHLFPFAFMIITSLKPAQETLRMPPTIFPEEIDTSAWELMFNVVTADDTDPRVSALLREPYIVYFRNSMIQALGSLALSLPITAFAAYANSKLQQGREARFTFLFFIGTLMIPAIVTLIPSFLLTRNFPFPLPQAPMIPGTDMQFPVLRIWDTHWAIIIPSIFNGFNFLLFKGFFDTIPDSIIQAARVDGGSELNIFRRIVLPMSVPVFAVAAWTQFGAVWNSFLWPLVVTQSADSIPTTVAVQSLINRVLQSGATTPEQANSASVAMQKIMEAGLSWNGMMVLSIIQTIPIFIMFLICQEYLLKGIRIRGLK